MNKINMKRIYEPPEKTDGYRILVDRLWPRGVSKERADINYWAKDITTSAELRKTFKHTADTWDEFRIRYLNELDNNEHAVEFISFIKEKLQKENVTLLYAAKNEQINHVIVLKEWLEERI